MIEVNNLTYRYEGSSKNALTDVSFTIQKGEICGFLAPNGGGKTTLFKILATMLPSQSGSISFNGKDYRSDYTSIRKTIGVVFQHPSVDRKLTVLENLRCQTYLYGNTPSSLKTTIEDVIKMFGLESYINQKVELLSGGFQRRVELAKCILHNPDVLLLDEPSTGLDIGSRRELWHHIKELSTKKQVTSLITTHLIEEAEKCDRVIILDKGKIIIEGKPSILKDDIGGEILLLKSDKTDDLLSLLRSKWNIEGTPVDGIVRIEIGGQKHILNSLLTEHLELIDSATLHKPSLADVFFKYTGNQFEESVGMEEK